MTPDKTPSDAEIMREADKVGGLFDDLAIGYLSDDILTFARAALAKWGTPVVAGEVAAHRVMRKQLDGNWVCDGRYWSDGPPSKELVESICSDKDRWRVDVAYTTPQPTQAQAGAVESAEYGQFLSDVLTAAGLVTHGKQCKALGERLADMCVKLRHHGSKGGQHE